MKEKDLHIISVVTIFVFVVLIMLVLHNKPPEYWQLLPSVDQETGKRLLLTCETQAYEVIRVAGVSKGVFNPDLMRICLKNAGVDLYKVMR